jgi:hypothetical protein
MGPSGIVFSVKDYADPYYLYLQDVELHGKTIYGQHFAI